MCRQAVHAAQRRRHALAASRHVALLPTTSEPYEPPARVIGVRCYLGGARRRWKAHAHAYTAVGDGSRSGWVESCLLRNCPCRAARRGAGGTAPRAAPAAATARCRTSADRAAAFAARAAPPPRRSSPGEARVRLRLWANARVGVPSSEDDNGDGWPCGIAHLVPARHRAVTVVYLHVVLPRNLFRVEVRVASPSLQHDLFCSRLQITRGHIKGKV